jgi:hypothetical protein
MPMSATRDQFASGLRDFAWNEWSQMGVLASPRRRSPWAQDPEALVVFTLEVARDDPRLFDELLDWLVVNERLISVRRLRALCRTPDDRRLLEAALGWVGGHRPRARLSARERELDGEKVPLFRGRFAVSPHEADEAFAAQGLLRPRVGRTRKAQSPDLGLPINFAFRLRQLLGVGARAEASRFLLTVDAPRVTAQAVARSAGYAKRNVYEALTELQRAGVVSVTTVGAEQFFAVDRHRWATFLDHPKAALPSHRDWPQLLGAAVRLLRWMGRPDLDDLSEYLRSSQALDLLEQVGPELRYAGVETSAEADLSAAVDDVAALAETLLQQLGVHSPSLSRLRPH